MDTNKDQTNSEDYIATVSKFLRQTLPTTPQALQATLRQTETYHINILAARINAQTELSQRRQQYLHPKDPSMTDTDRRIHLEANIADYQAQYDLLTGLEAALKLRIDIIQTLLTLD